VDVQPALKAYAQLAKARKPRMRALYHPAVFAQSVFAFDASARNARLYAFAAQVVSALVVVVAFVRVQFVWALSGSALQSRYWRDGLQCGLEGHAVVSVGSRDCQRQRDALGIYDDVALAAQFAPVCGVGACFLAPRGLGTLAASKLARLQSIWSHSRRRTSSAWCS